MMYEYLLGYLTRKELLNASQIKSPSGPNGPDCQRQEIKKENKPNQRSSKRIPARRKKNKAARKGKK